MPRIEGISPVSRFLESCMDSVPPAALLNWATYRIRDMEFSYGNYSIKDISEHGLHRARLLLWFEYRIPQRPVCGRLSSHIPSPPVLKFPGEEATLGRVCV